MLAVIADIDRWTQAVILALACKLVYLFIGWRLYFYVVANMNHTPSHGVSLYHKHNSQEELTSNIWIIVVIIIIMIIIVIITVIGTRAFWKQKGAKTHVLH